MARLPCTPDMRNEFATRRHVRHRRRWLWTLSLIAVCGLVLPGAGGGDAGKAPSRPFDDTTPARHVSADAPRIVAFGNSLTAGLGVSPDVSYPAHLQRQLHEAGYHYTVVNAGVSGETTAGGVRRLPWILKSRPSIVILELGANDGLRGHPLSGIESNLTTIIEGLQEGGAVVVLAGMQIPANYGVDYTTGFASLFERVARTHSVTLIPFFLEGVATRKALNQSDGIHPTGEGYRIVAGTVFDVITPLLKKAGPGSS